MNYLVWDMDGTLTFTRSVAVEAALYGLRAFAKTRGIKLDLPTPTEIWKHVGKPADQYYQSLLPQEFKSCWRELKAEINPKEYSLLLDGRDVVPPGLRDLLARWGERVPMYVATNAGDFYAEHCLKAQRLNSYFKGVWTFDRVGGQGKAQALKEIALQEGSKGIMIGDTLFDIEAAQEVGWCSIEVDWSFMVPDLNLERKELGADFYAESVQELEAVLADCFRA